MTTALGTEKWKNAFSKIDKGRITFTRAEKADQFFKGVKKEDVLMKVPTGPGDDALFFVLSSKQDNTWLIRMESTDY